MSDLSVLIIDHYERHAEAWDADRQSASWGERCWHERFAASLSQGTHVLDLGCGSGWPVARHLVERGLKVTGVDSSPSMIALCRSRLPEEEWIVADMRTLSLGRRFDGVLAWQSCRPARYIRCVCQARGSFIVSDVQHWARAR
jgi:ubiquinone/menaquinone biosynthesis C-methylase UbiE